MVRKLFLVCSLLVAACGSDESAEPGGPCKADLTCAGDLVCNFQATAPICVLPEGDEDGDGLKNEADFCPMTAGGSNHDEDGDKQGDACDQCPIERWAVGTKDTDGDGVVGVCDPVANDKGDSLLFFEGFGSDTALASWMLSDASLFSVSGDSLKVRVAAATPDALASYALPISSDSSVAFLGFRVTDAAPAGVDVLSRDVSLSLLDPSPAAGGSRAKCGGTLTDQGSVLRLTTDAGESTEPFPGLFALGQAYRILLQSEGATARCAQTRGATSQSAENPVGNVGKAVVALSQRGVIAEYDYVMVVRSPLLR
jgi:Thrombospondin type 3 repeat